MTFDLEVDTDALRQAAGLVAAMAQRYRVWCPTPRPLMPDGALGRSPMARQAQARAERRAGQALELASGLASAAEDLSRRILAAAAAFDAVEPVGRAGR